MNIFESNISEYKIKSAIVDKAIHLMAKHPYICAFLVCIFLHPFYFGAEWNVPNNALSIETLIVLTIGLSFIYSLYKSYSCSFVFHLYSC